MKKMKILKYLAIVIVGGIIISSCGDDFLDLKPQGSLDGIALESPDGIEASLVSAYSMLDGWNSDWTYDPWPKDAAHWVFATVVADDAYKGSDAGDIPDILQLELFQWLPSNGLFDALFTTRYEGVARVNATRNLNNNSTEIPADRKAVIDGETKFLRAHYHFDLYRAFVNIPYYTEEDIDFRKPNDIDVLPSIIADLESAVSLLPNSQDEVGRATKGAANAYLGKVHMFNNDYSSAKTAFDAVVNSGIYSLADCYHDNFNADKENGPESLFAVQFSVNDGDAGANNGNYGTRLGFPHETSPFGCCGFNQPSQNLVNAFKVDADGLPLLDNFNDADVTSADFVDPRLDWTVGRDDVPYYDHGTHQPTWIRDRAFGGPFSPKKMQFHKEQNDAVGSGGAAGAWGNQASALNHIFIRYADVLLMLAEAEVELGSPTNLERARELVNMVRTRAGNCAQGLGTSGSDIETAIDDASITWANYKVGTYDAAWTDAAIARKAVRHERRIELAQEGHRLYDLRRWGVLESTMNDYISVEKTKRNYLNDALNVEAKHNAYPIPTVQIDLSTIEGSAKLIQNPGF